VQGTKEDLDLFKDGITHYAMVLASTDDSLLTGEEKAELAIGNLPASVFEKIKDQNITVRAFDNSLNVVTLEQAMQIVHLQAKHINDAFTEKWTRQKTIIEAMSVEEVVSA